MMETHLSVFSFIQNTSILLFIRLKIVHTVSFKRNCTLRKNFNKLKNYRYFYFKNV